MSVLDIKNLCVNFGSFAAVKNVSLSIEKGEMLALVGESGSGKSLTALSCLGLQPPAARISGSILLDGHEIISGGQQAAEPSARLHVSASRRAAEASLRALRGKTASMVFQEPMTSLNPLHTIGRQIEEMWSGGVKEWWGKSTPSPHHPITPLLEHVGLAHFAARLDAYPHQLSGGERQRVMIAMAIANNPALLIADEPTTAVDVTIQAKILDLLKKLQREMGMAVLFVTHDLTIVKRLADRVEVMKAGEIVEQGSVSQIFANPAQDYTKQLLASEPKGTPPAPPAGAKTVMACENLNVFFPIKKGILRRTAGYVKAVQGVSLSIPESSTLGIVGESGSGKTTLGFALLRLLKSDGRIVFFGQNIQGLNQRALRPLRKKMQVVFQDPYASLNPRMNVGQIIEEGLLIHEAQLSERERTEAIQQILNEVGLPADILHRYPHEFSGGQRQRISIARAMVLKPKFVVLDEPTSALDLTVQAQIIELLRNLQASHGLSYLFISHDLRVVRAISHRILVMRQGQIVEEGTAADIFERPKEAYTKALIKAAFLTN